MELLEQYEADTRWKHERLSGSYPTGGGLERKVDPESGTFRPFPGTTTVFRLPDGMRRVLAGALRDPLTESLRDAGLLACECLPEDSFHVTLHDLVSPDLHRSGRVFAPDGTLTGAYRAEMDRSAAAAREALRAIRQDHPGAVVRMTADRIVSLTAKSAALLIKPRTNEDFGLLTAWYDRLQSVVALPYPYRPHITLAYYRPGVLNADLLQRAIEPLQIRPDQPWDFELRLSWLTVQRFSDMRTFTDVPRRICFVCDGGLNRSVMAACLLNHAASQRGLPFEAEARAGTYGTDGCPVPDSVWQTLRAHGVAPDSRLAMGRSLQREDLPAFTAFAPISFGAVRRMQILGAARSRWEPLARIFGGVADPADTGDYEAAFRDLSRRITLLTDGAFPE